nr:MAG TPA: hypothetical protein [Crassvirales sp.]
MCQFNEIVGNRKCIRFHKPDSLFGYYLHTDFNHVLFLCGAKVEKHFQVAKFILLYLYKHIKIC